MGEAWTDFPKTLGEFETRFPNEVACRDFLVAVRWPTGFQCPRCGETKSWELGGGLLVECSGCGGQTSLTSGTVLHGTRKPLRTWFQAMWWICTQKTGGSAKGLQRLLGFGCYETAWTWLHKLRAAMTHAAREPLVGPVEIDDAFIGGVETGVSGRETHTKAALAVAVEMPVKGERAMGRIRLLHVPDFSAASLLPFVGENVVEGSRVVTDDWKGYTGLSLAGYRHDVHVGGGKLLPHVHLVISLLKRWLLGTHQGAVSNKYLQSYLEEFTFRFNRRKSHHVGKIFYRMLQGASSADPLTIGMIKGRPETPDYAPYNI